jgi:hypothetical protein
MSGGHFDHLQYRLMSMAGELKDQIDTEYKQESMIKKLLSEVCMLMELTSVIMQRADYFLSGDEDSESFIKRFKEDLRQLNAKRKDDALAIKLNTAIELLRNAECSGEAYADISQRGKWKLERDQLLNELQ